MIKKIEPKHKRAIVGLLTSKSIKEAAEQVGISEKTLHRWLHEPNFQNALYLAESEIIDQLVFRLVSLSLKAIDTLEEISIDHSINPSTRLNAALHILRLMQDFQKSQELNRRLFALEKVVYSILNYEI